jgi:hypothetical protein
MNYELADVVSGFGFCFVLFCFRFIARLRFVLCCSCGPDCDGVSEEHRILRQDTVTCTCIH